MKKAVPRLYILVLMTLTSIRCKRLQGPTYPKKSRPLVFKKELIVILAVGAGK